MESPTTPTNASLSWLEVWMAAITKPQPATYRDLVNDPKAKPRRAALWIALTSMISSFVAFNVLFNNPEIIAALVVSTAEVGQPLTESQITQTLFLTSLCAVPLAAIFSVFIYGVLAFIIQFVADQMGVPQRTKGKLKPLFYLIGAIVAPMNIVLAFLNTLTILSFLAIVGYVYQIYLMVRAAQGLYEMDTRTAMIAVGAPMLIFTMLQLIFLNGALA